MEALERQRLAEEEERLCLTAEQETIMKRKRREEGKEIAKLKEQE